MTNRYRARPYLSNTFIFVLATCIFSVANLWAGDDLSAARYIEKIAPETPVRGDLLTITVGQLDGVPFAGAAFLRLKAQSSSNGDHSIRCFPKGNSNSFSARLPFDLPIGLYRAGISTTEEGPVDYTRLLRVAREPSPPLKIDAVWPSTVYSNNGTYTLTLLGDFSSLPEDHSLVLDGRNVFPSSELSVRAEGTHKLIFSSIPAANAGKTTASIRVGDEKTKPVPVTLAYMSKGRTILLSVLTLATLITVVLALVYRGIEGYHIAGNYYGPLRAFFLDKETDSYSLSKFQFYAWTLASLFGYIYLFLSRSLVQLSFEFPDIPSNLPSLIFISVATSVAASGIQRIHGPKGSGAVLPSMADFISTGGLVVPERFQFFVWTLLGVIVFVVLVVLNDAATISTLPAIPDNFLYLMGVSSAGYLAGRIARKPGPVIDTATVSPGSLVFELRGRFLSRRARIELNGTDIPFRTAEEAAGQSPPPFNVMRVITPDAQTPDQQYAAVMQVTILDAKPWEDLYPDLRKLSSLTENSVKLHPPLELTIINPDGQRSVADVTLVPKANATAPLKK